MYRVPSVGSSVPGTAWMKGGVVPRPSGTPAVRPLPGMNPAPAAGPPAPWSPAKIDPPQQVNVGAALGSINSGGVGGGYVVPVHNPQPNYWPSQNAMGGGNGFAGGTGWAGTNVGASATNGISQWGGDNAQNAPNPFAQAVSGPAMTPEQQLAASYQQAQQSALDANQKRYDDILAGYGNTLDRTRARLDGLGEQQKKDLAAQYDRNAGRISSDLVARGMSNTTVKDNLIQGNERERASANNRLQEALTREYVGYDTGLEKDRLQFMERRTDSYPDFDQMIRLSQMMGAAGNGAAGGMGGMNVAASFMPANGFQAPGNFGMANNPHQFGIANQGAPNRVPGVPAQNQQAMDLWQQMMAGRFAPGYGYGSQGGLGDKTPSQINPNLSDYT